MIANSKQNRKKTQNKKMQKTRFLKEQVENADFI